MIVTIVMDDQCGRGHSCKEGEGPLPCSVPIGFSLYLQRRGVEDGKMECLWTLPQCCTEPSTTSLSGKGPKCKGGGGFSYGGEFAVSTANCGEATPLTFLIAPC